MMYAVYADLAGHIKNMIPDIRWIDRDKGQLDNPEKFNSIITPGVLIDFGSVSWKGQSRGAQTGEGSVTFKIIFQLPVATHQDAEWNKYVQFEILTKQLYEAVSSNVYVNDRRGSSDYFTEHFYVVEQTFDLIVYELKGMSAIPKPKPDIKGALSHTLIIPQ